jgi:hypothetical protein
VFDGTDLDALDPLLDGPSPSPTAATSVVERRPRELVDWAKKVEELDLKGAVLDGSASRARRA